VQQRVVMCCCWVGEFKSQLEPVSFFFILFFGVLFVLNPEKEKSKKMNF
jgi:hypothetical protein